MMRDQTIRFASNTGSIRLHTGRKGGETLPTSNSRRIRIAFAVPLPVWVWGEFGRTPVISNIVGCDHWPRVNSALIAGGGMKLGQMIGATDRLAVERPVTFGEVFATLYQNLGIDPGMTVNDLNGRPQYIVEGARRPLRELV